MKLYNVGVDQLREYELAEFDSSKYSWMVYWYEGGGHEGEGEAVALGNDGLLYCTSLGHCSCYGPTDGGFGEKGETVQQFFAPKDSIFDRDFKDVVMAKVRELLHVEK